LLRPRKSERATGAAAAAASAGAPAFISIRLLQGILTYQDENRKRKTERGMTCLTVIDWSDD